MYFSKEYKDSIESVTVVNTSPMFELKNATVVTVTFKQWWKPSRKWKFSWITTDISGDIYTSTAPQTVNVLLEALTTQHVY